MFSHSDIERGMFTSLYIERGFGELPSEEEVDSFGPIIKVGVTQRGFFVFSVIGSNVFNFEVSDGSFFTFNLKHHRK